MNTTTMTTNDTRRLHPTQRLRLLMRCNANSSALALALQLGELDVARRAAWNLIERGADWTVETEAGEALPLLSGASDGEDWTMSERKSLEARWLRVEGARVPLLWDERVAHRFAVDVAQIVVERTVLQLDLDEDSEQDLRDDLELARSCSNESSTRERASMLSNLRAQWTYARRQDVFTRCTRCQSGFTCAACESLVAIADAEWVVFYATTPERAGYAVTHALVALVGEDALDEEHDDQREAFVREVLAPSFLARTLLS